MKYFKIGLLVLGAALLANCAANAWLGNYLLATSEGTSILWMVAWWYALRCYEALKPLAEREEAWGTYWLEARRWLGEFPDARDALDHLRLSVDGKNHLSIQRLRDNMRARGVDDGRFEADRARGVRLTDHRFRVDADGDAGRCND